MAMVDSFTAEPPPLRMTAEGIVRVGRTRVTLDTIIEAYEDGDTPEQIVRDYSSLELADVYAAISYYLRHRGEVEAYLEERRRRAEAVRRENEARFPPDGVRERLLARRQRTGNPDAGVSVGAPLDRACVQHPQEQADLRVQIGDLFDVVMPRAHRLAPPPEGAPLPQGAAPMKKQRGKTLTAAQVVMLPPFAGAAHAALAR